MKRNSSYALRLLLFIACLGLGSIETTQAQRQQASARYVCPMHAEVTSRKPGSCPKCMMKLVARKRDGAQATTPAASSQSQSTVAAATAERVRALEQLAPSYEFTCSMHPEIHQAQEGVCPKCGMPLTTVKPSVRGAYRLDVVPTPRAPKPGEALRLNFVVSHPETGARVRDYVLNHERLFHLFIVSADLNEYQ
ncbi:MAG TPA: heavy metal-binding domain-containing protein, partial [Pyrinomonadaceae bacterium]